MVPGPSASSSRIGLSSNDMRMDAVSGLVPSRICDAIAYILISLEDNAPLTYRGNVSRAVRAVAGHTEELFSAATKLELARNYLAAKLNWQGESAAYPALGARAA